MNENHQDVTAGSDGGQWLAAREREREKTERFVRLLLEHEPQVRAYLRGLLPSWEDVDDVVQEAGLIAWRKFGHFEDGTSFGGWFLTIARLEAFGHRRKLSKTPLVFADDVWELLAEETHEEPQLRYRKHLETCLQKMDDRKRDIMMKVHSPGAITRELAGQFGKSEQAFYKLIQRLRTSLYRCVSQSLAGEDAR